MALAPAGTPTPSGYAKYESDGFTFYFKGDSPSSTKDMVYIGPISFKGSPTKVDGKPWRISEIGNLMYNSSGISNKDEITAALAKYTSIMQTGEGFTNQSGPETARLFRQEEAQKQSVTAIDPTKSVAEQKQVGESELGDNGIGYNPDEINAQNQAALDDALASDTASNIDPLTGQAKGQVNAKDFTVLQSPDSSELKDFMAMRQKYLKGNMEVDPSILFELTSISSVDRALGQTMRGLNLLKAPTSVPTNKDSKGYIFFTRPQLNLQDSNIGNHRKFYPLLSDMPTSMQRQIRGLLDPRIQRTLPVLGIPGQTSMGGNIELMRKAGYASKPLDCPFVDPLNPFIPVLTNTCETMSGFPDLGLNTFSSKPGMHKESYVQYDDIAITSETIDIECSFKGILSDPITWIFYIWEMYGSLVFDGTLMPYMDYIGENWIDYQTRIWRLVMDKSNTFVTKIAATGPAIPISLPYGAMFDFDVDSPYGDQSKSISIRFRCMGAEALDDILVDEFNETVYMFNPNMMDDLRNKYYTKVDKVHSVIMNHLAYPHIDVNTYELEWYVKNEIYTRVISNMKAAGVYGGNY